MPYVRFVGDPMDELSGPNTLTQWGVDFTKGEWVEVSGGDAKRFANHSHFEVEDAKPKAERGRKAAAEPDADE